MRVVNLIKNRSHQTGSLSSSAAWLMLGKTMGFAFAVVLPLALVRILSQQEFALYKQAFLVVDTGIWVLPLGFGMSAYYFLPRERERRGSVVLNVVLFNVVMGSAAGLTLIWWPSVLGTVFRAQEIVEYAPLIGLVILTGVVASFMEIVVLANQETQLVTIVIVASQCSKAGLLLLATIMFGSVRALIVAAVVQGTLQALVLLLYLRSRFGRFWRQPSWIILREQFAYALPLSLSGLLLVVYTNAHSYFVASRFEPAAFAIYAVGCFELPLIGLLAESVGAVLIPRASLLQHEGASREIVRLLLRVMRKLATVYFPIYAFMLVLGKEFLSALFTEPYAASWPVLAINMAMLPFSVLALDPIVRAFGQLSRFLLKLRTVVVALQLATLWVVTARFGLVSTIAVVAASRILEQVILACQAARTLGVAWADLGMLKDVAKIGMVTIGAATTAAIMRLILRGVSAWPVLIVGGSTFALTYGLGLWSAGVLTPEERLELGRRVKRIGRQFFLRRLAEPQAS